MVNIESRSSTSSFDIQNPMFDIHKNISPLIGAFLFPDIFIKQKRPQSAGVDD
jgi:hypothetical protein